MDKQDKLELISDAMNSTLYTPGIYFEIGEALGIELDADSPIFHEIEEYILLKYEEMNQSHWELDENGDNIIK